MSEQDWERVRRYQKVLDGKLIDVSFVRFLRAEIKFPNSQALVEQIGRDAADARRVLGTPPSP